jgi:trans-2-enoyl-CoA reductase
MSKNSGINDTFIEAMVNKVINAITDKLEELDISLDYIAAALIDNASAQDIATRQKRRGRMREDKRNLDDQD